MKLARRLESQMNYVFAVTAALGFIVLGLHTYLSVSQVREKAAKLIVSHLREIAMAGITAQSTADIDREVARLTEVWRATQDIDLRSDIYVDGQLIAHSGQLQKFGFLSSDVTETFELPSNQRLEINIQLDLWGNIVSNILISTVFFVFLSGCYLLIRSKLFKTIREISAPIESRADWLSSVYGSFPQTEEYLKKFSSSPLEEVRNLDASLLSFIKQIHILEDQASRNSFDLGRVKMAEQFAHNIRGPLSSLQLKINVLNLPQDQKNKLIEGVNNVLLSSKALLLSRKTTTNVLPISKEKTTEFDLIPLVEATLDEMQGALGDKIKFCLEFPTQSFERVKGNSLEIRSMLENLITNSVESIVDEGKIRISLDNSDGFHILKITDTGCGIPEEILPRLMREGATFGKRSGTGLGLWHARNTMDGIGGRIQITSTRGSGTTVSLHFPLVVGKVKLPLQAEFTPGQTVVILDDDSLIHQSWDLKLNSMNLNLIHLYSVDEFEEWFQIHGPGDFGSRIYLMDYDLKHESKNGIYLITKYHLTLEARLVTGAIEDTNVIRATRENKIRVISKTDLADLKILVLNSSDGTQQLEYQGESKEAVCKSKSVLTN